ncbi:hypothetical protein FHX64_001814 [Microbacter margulisiae]|uniref:Uncharacterized protein n=1 Tax=Microbacter margulisiae TaxID=1350067 RepID=A0A7W5DRL6_9PORP|nr:hypothetical protein [Microbacter margulisiae]
MDDEGEEAVFELRQPIIDKEEAYKLYQTTIFGTC